ncbi:uncharacterized protein MONBRDRAFT_26029 [Monosiga brevicollis MX1]|uniref:Protein HIRA n=1 Tax=Monosiga brevicollis TaxID=81824 RepID=A9V160_MONBE|nr:uncharacterized protein MONBRDRAFT_26029 [Monosiga brevicollis MX1]EDQ88875.1 predicted protein [Monosiga brevicollis MX1]|eukprot:XP_001746488.1 hypothetical protein [Monosiga brevicollis MX1]
MRALRLLATSGLDEHSGILASLSEHSASVNCVRWHPYRLLLASCSDDGLILLWQPMTGAFASNFGEEQSTEGWRPQTVLRGHGEIDIVSLAWSPDGDRLISCAIDHRILVWQTSTARKICELEGHDAPVRGISWDPLGAFVASQGEDQKVCIWDTTTWKQEAVVTEHFSQQGASGMFYRLDWTADGLGLIAVHGQNNHFPVAVSIDRKRSGYEQPLAAIRNLFSNSVTDIAWSPLGAGECVCVSVDGSVALISLSPGEIGIPFSNALQHKRLQELYGPGVFERPVMAANSAAFALARSVDAVAASHGPEADSPSRSSEPGRLEQHDGSPAAKRRLEPVSMGSSAAAMTYTHQRERRTSDNRRRIQPMVGIVSSTSTPLATSVVGNTSSDPAANSVITTTAQPVAHVAGPLVDLSAAALSDSFTCHVAADQTATTPKLRLEINNTWVKYTEHKKSHVMGLVQCFGPEENTAPLPSSSHGMAGDEAASSTQPTSATRSASQLDVTQAAPPTPIWEAVVGEKVACCATSTTVLALASQDGHLHFFSLQAGLRLSPPFRVAPFVALMRFVEDVLIVVTSSARVYAWRVDSKGALSKLYANVDLQPVLPGRSNSSTLAGVDLLDNTTLIVYLQMKGLAARHPFPSVLAPPRALSAAVQNTDSALLRLQSRVNVVAASATQMREAAALDESALRLVKVSQAEANVVTARVIGDVAAFEHAVLQFARICAEVGAVDPLRALCRGLLQRPPASPLEQACYSCTGCDTLLVLRRVLMLLASRSDQDALVEDMKELLDEAQASLEKGAARATT